MPRFVVLRPTPLRICKVIAGKRTELASVDVEFPAGQWHTLTATMKDNQIVADAGGTQLSVRDDTLGLLALPDGIAHQVPL